MNTVQRKLIIEVDINATIEKVWEAFTNPDVLKQWFTPAAMNNNYISVDMREGGLFRYCFKMNEGDAEFWGRGIYEKITEPNYLSYRDCFTDAEGNDVPPSYFNMPGDDIVETLVEFFFTTKGEVTTLKMVGENPFDAKMTEDMTDGWNSMFDNLIKTIA